MRRYYFVGLLLSFYVVGAIFGDPPAPSHGVIPLATPTLPSERPGNVGYQVGGGTALPHFGEPRRAEEGTWGWDYQGWLFPRRVISGWWHGRRDQGGTGAYQTDGPRLYQEK